MSEDWSAVSRAINERMTQLGMRQRVLIERSRVSKAVVSQLMRDVTPQPRRSARTLEALSVALGWHPEHLSAVLTGRELPSRADSTGREDVPSRLAVIEQQLRDVTRQLDELRSSTDQQFESVRKLLIDLAGPKPDSDESADR